MEATGRFRHHLLALVMALAGAIALVSLLGEMQFSFRAFQFRARVQFFDGGYTEVQVPPVGLVRARTHATPVKLTVRLESVDLDLLRQLLAEAPARTELLREAQAQSLRVVRWFVLRILLLGLLGGLAGVLLLGRRRPRELLQGGVAGLLLVGALAVGTGVTYNPRAFANPRYEGVLKAAPWMVGLAEETLGRVQTLGRQLEIVAGNLYTLFQRVDTLAPLAETVGDVRVLHVSDIHNNPAAYDFISRTARVFGADLVIDTGDISDYGTPLEAGLVSRLRELGLPYLYVPGNHDSPAIIREMAKLPGVRVLDGKPVHLAGLTIQGYADPASRGTGIEPLPVEELLDYAQGLRADLARLPESPDILAVHNHRVAAELAGVAPVIVYGHDHRAAVRSLAGSVLCDAGTSGAAGVRGLQVREEVPYSLTLLHFRLHPPERPRLLAVDMVRVSNLASGFTLERRGFLPPEGASREELPEWQRIGGKREEERGRAGIPGD